MKKVFFLLLLSGACHSFVQAQFSGGLRLGAMSSAYWKMDVADAGKQLFVRPQIGLLGEYALNGQLSLHAELNFAPKGDAWYFDYSEGKREEIRDVFNYLEIPLMAKYSFAWKSALKPYIIGGLYFARALSNKYTEDGVAFDVAFPKGDIGLHIGGGASIQLGPGLVFAELRYAQGLKDLDVFGDGTHTRMRGPGLSVGWMKTF